MIDAWVGVAGTLFGALVGWLGGLATARYAARLAAANAMQLREADRAAAIQDRKAALLEELRANVVILNQAAKQRQFGVTQRAAWNAVIGERLTDETRTAVQMAYARAASYDGSVARIPPPGTGNPHAEATNGAQNEAKAAVELFSAAAEALSTELAQDR